MKHGSSKPPPCEFGPQTYETWCGSELGVITEGLEDELLFELIGEAKNRQVLDVGCGEGALSLTLWRRGARVTGIDPSAAMIDAARRRAAGADADIPFCRAKAEAMPFPDGQFDLVLAKTILCFVDDATDVFAETARVLRPGGRLVIGELGKWSSWALQRYIRGKLGSPLWRHGHFWTQSELRGLAERAGLRVETFRGAVYYPRCRLAARLIRPVDPKLGRITTLGAAFLAMTAVKP